MDLVLAIAALPFAVPVCAAAAVAIRFETKGSPIFAQERVGRDSQPIIVYKLRTMFVDTESAPSHELSTASVTRVGELLRKTKVDELPQLVNVLRGEMSFVGPRPCLPSQHELIAEREARGVNTLLPGITGPSQLEGIDMSTPVELAESDARYLSSSSLILDLSYIVRTALGRGSGDAVGGAA